jgi:hypothetical protein
MIRRVLIAEPHGGEGSQKRWAEQRLRGQAMRDDKRRERSLLLDPWRPASRSIFSRYVREAKNWSSVTPVVLPGFDDGRHPKAEKLCLRAIAQAGLPSSMSDGRRHSGLGRFILGSIGGRTTLDICRLGTYESSFENPSPDP